MRRVLAVAAGTGVALAASVAASRFQPAQAPVHAPAGGPSAEASNEPSTPEPPARMAVIGARYDDDSAMAAHAEEVASYTLRATLDPAEHTVTGEGTIVWRNLSSAPVRELWVHLYMNGFKSERTLFNRVVHSGFRGGVVAGDPGQIRVKKLYAREMAVDLWPTADRTSPGDPQDETDIRVPLPREIGPKESVSLDIEWETELPPLIFRTGHYGSFHMVAQWFPKLARLEPDGVWAHFPFHRLSEFYADFGSYDVTVDVPEGYVVGSTGVVESELRAAGRHSTRYVQRDVHDFAFAAWDGFEELRATSDDGVAIRCLYPPGHGRAAADTVESARFGLRHLGAAFGRYPYPSLTIVHPPAGADEAGGMEYPTLITTGGGWYLPYSGVRGLELVTVHELGHQWFYGLVANDEHTWPFLDEGVNSWAETDAMETLYPQASVARTLGLEIGLPATWRINAHRADRADVIARGAHEFPTGSDYSALVYGRTATALSTLGNVYGRDELRRAVGRYARRYRFEHPTPDDLLASIEEVLGGEASSALQEALNGGWVDYSAELFGREALIRRRGSVVLPVDVDLVGADGTVTRVRWDAHESSTTFAYEGPGALVAVNVDPEHRVLLDDDLTNNAARAGRSGSAPRVLERALFWGQVLLGAVAP